MSRPIHPGLLLGVIATASFLAGILIEPMFERPSSASVPTHATATRVEPVLPSAPFTSPKGIEPVPPAQIAVEASAPDVPLTEPSADSEDAPPSTVSGADPDSHVEFIEMKNAPAEDGRGEVGRDVDMIDEPNQSAGDAIEAPPAKDKGTDGAAAAE